MKSRERELKCRQIVLECDRCYLTVIWKPEYELLELTLHLCDCGGVLEPVAYAEDVKRMEAKA